MCCFIILPEFLFLSYKVAYFSFRNLLWSYTGIGNKVKFVMSDEIELCELNTSLIHHFTLENNFNGLKEIVTQRSEDIDKRNEVSLQHRLCFFWLFLDNL